MDLDILGTTRDPEFCDIKESDGYRVIEDQLNTQELNHLGLYRSVAILSIYTELNR